MELSWSVMKKFRGWSKEECLDHDDAILARAGWDELRSWIKFISKDEDITRSSVIKRMEDIDNKRNEYFIEEQ